MEEREFIEHWTNVIIDDLRVQRESADNVADAIPECFGQPLRAGPPAAALALHVRKEPLSTPDPGGAFNMIDLIRSALVLDDLSPVFRAYPVALRWQLPADLGETTAEKEAPVGHRFSQNLLNRSPACQACHSSRFSISGIGSGWNRTHPIPYDLEVAIYGTVYASAQAVVEQAYPIFRDDQFVRDPPPSAGPWGLTGCGGVLSSLAALPPRQVSIAGVSGTRVGIADLAQAFKEGMESLAATGPVLTPQPNNPPSIPPKQALAYMTAMTATENVWKEVMGERLTIANYFPRNVEQRDALWELGEQTFLRTGWSLKTLLVRIMTSDYFNRRSPDVGSGTTPYRQPMIFDPWVADDPRSPPPPVDAKELNNGQGDLVHRLTPAGLLYSIAAAFDWPSPPRFLDGSGFASTQLVKASGQYINENEQGRKGADFQGLLVWESELGLCQKPASVRMDWIDRVVAAIPAFDVGNPTMPATVADVVSTVKDWILVDGKIRTTAPLPPPGSPALATEWDTVARLFGVGLNTPASTAPNLKTNLRAYCGVLLKSPQFMLTGIDAAGDELTFPRLRVCNSGACSYGDLCSGYSRTLAGAGRSVECDGASRTVRQLKITALKTGEPVPGAKSAWPAFDEFLKRSRETTSFASRPMTMTDIPEQQRQTGPAHFGLGGNLPASAEEANARLDKYRSSEAFERSHPNLKRR
jgi:hypothetical protein